MKLFMGFVLICFIAGILLQKHDNKTQLSFMFGLALLVSIGYLFFNQI
jgi:uncharacterized membrane protein YfcA